MNVLLITDDLFPGGVQRHVTDLANRLSERGHHVAVAAAEGPFRGRLGHEVQFFHVPLARQGRRTLWSAVRAAITLMRIVRVGNFDIVHTHMRYSDVFGRACALLAGIGHVSTCHSMFVNHRWISVFGNETIAPTRAVKEMLLTSYGKHPDSVTVIYNDPQPMEKISSERRRELKKTYGIGTQTVLFSVSRFAPEKDIGTALRGLKILKQRGVENVKYLLVGHGELHGSVLDMIKAYGLEDWVHVLPATSDVGAVMSIGDVGILSSRTEGGIPYVVLEAASLGKTVVATATSGAMEFIHHDHNGMLYPVGDAEKLADCVQQLIRNKSLKKTLGRQALVRYRQFHLKNRSIEHILAVYEKLQNRGKR
ncbi:MAG: glycosyl transferase [Bacteroidia bacterium]|nr:MAG: glycosyl transferase [Bacteroidia bacterium]